MQGAISCILSSKTSQDSSFLHFRYNMQPNTVSSPLGSLITPEKVDPQTHTMGLIVETDLSSSVTCVGGILLTKHHCPSTGAIVSDVYSCYMHQIPLLRF